MNQEAKNPALSKIEKAQARVETHLDQSRTALETAEKSYPPVLEKYDQLAAQTPGQPEAERLKHALREVAGDKADEVGASIARDLDKKQMFDAGERVASGKRALSDARLDEELKQFTTEYPVLQDIKKHAIR